MLRPMEHLDGWGFDHEEVIRETWLSRKPKPRAFPVAAAGVLVLVFVSAIYWSDAFSIASYLPATRESVFFRGEYWRLVTSMFVHADFEHLLSNAVVFGVLGFLLFGYFGPGVFPGLTLLLGACVTAVSLQSYPAKVSLVGASGLVYLMAGFWLTLYLLLERRHSLNKRVMRAVGFGIIVLIPTAVEPAVSYRTHFIGLVAGATAGFAYFRKKKDALRAAERVERI